VSARGALSRELAYVAGKPIFFVEDYVPRLRRDDRVAGPSR